MAANIILVSDAAIAFSMRTCLQVSNESEINSMIGRRVMNGLNYVIQKPTYNSHRAFILNID